MRTHTAPSVKPHLGVVALYRVPVCQTDLFFTNVAGIGRACPCVLCLQFMFKCLLIMHAHNFCFQLIFSHCPVQSGKKCLETRFVIVLVCLNRSMCFALALTGHAFALLLFVCSEQFLHCFCCVFLNASKCSGNRFDVFVRCA